MALGQTGTTSAWSAIGARDPRWELIRHGVLLPEATLAREHPAAAPPPLELTCQSAQDDMSYKYS